jgi:hypothetical protein
MRERAQATKPRLSVLWPEPRVLFEKFYGGPPRIEPLLEWRGLTPEQRVGRR